MVHFEFGQDRLTQPHPLNSFELAQGAIKGAFVLFSTTLLGLFGFVLQNASSGPLESGTVTASGVLALLGLPLVEFSRLLDRFRIQ